MKETLPKDILDAPEKIFADLCIFQEDLASSKSLCRKLQCIFMARMYGSVCFELYELSEFLVDNLSDFYLVKL